MGISAFIVLAGLGVALLWRGLRGRRVGDHPHCRRCGFDLFGAPAEAERCPECGADVKGARAVVMGRRERRKGSLGVAAALLAVVAIGLLIRSAGVDWRGRLPTWYVLREARTGNAASRVVPIDQLLARDAATPLTSEDRVRLARAIIALQRDPANVWNPTWGNWVVARIEADVLPQDAVDGFFQNLFADFTVTMRTTVRQGERPVLQMVQRIAAGFPSRSPTTLSGSWNTAQRELTIDGKPANEMQGSFASGVDFTSGGTSSTTIRESAEAWDSLPLGPHAVEWSCPIVVYRGTLTWGSADAKLPVVARLPTRWQGTVTVLAKDAADVRLTPDPSKADAIRAAFERPRFDLSGATNRMSMFNVTLGKLPCDVAFDVFVQQGEGPEWKVCSIAHRTTGGTGSHGYGIEAGRLVAGVAEVILRPSPDAARSTPDLFEIWDGEIRLTDVPVK